MSQRPGFPIKRAFLFALIGSIGIGAAAGIYTLLAGTFSWLEVRVLLTTATIGAASICGMACGAYLATKRGFLLPWTGMGLTFAAAALILIQLWLENESEPLLKITASAAVFAVACAHLSLLSLARLANAYRWAIMAAYIAVLSVAALIVSMIVAEPKDDFMFRVLGVAAIFDAAFTVMVPIFHRLSKPDLAAADAVGGSPDTQAIDAEIAVLQARIEELERRKSGMGGRETAG